MLRKQLIPSSLISLFTCGFLALVSLPQAQAADPSGTWSWTMPARGGGEGRKMTLKLKMEGDKLSGALVTPAREGGQARETAIENAQCKGDAISFSVTREAGGNKMTSKYTGKLAGDTIKGKIEFDRGGETQSRDWEAKREK